VLTAARLLTGFHVVFVRGIIAALISLVYILAALLAGLLCAFVAASVRHDDSPWRVNTFYARQGDGL
jgi:hypothetical protein